MDYKQKLRDTFLKKKFIQSYYIRKARCFNENIEDLMRRFIDGKVIFDEDNLDCLAILFADIDPDIYDLDYDEKRACLEDICNELFKEKKPLIDYTPATELRPNKVQTSLKAPTSTGYLFDTRSSHYPVGSLKPQQRLSVKKENKSSFASLVGLHDHSKGVSITVDEDPNNINVLIDNATRISLGEATTFTSEFDL